MVGTYPFNAMAIFAVGELQMGFLPLLKVYKKNVKYSSIYISLVDIWSKTCRAGKWIPSFIVVDIAKNLDFWPWWKHCFSAISSKYSLKI